MKHFICITVIVTTLSYSVNLLFFCWTIFNTTKKWRRYQRDCKSFLEWKVHYLVAGHEIRVDSWHCKEELAQRLADIIQWMCWRHCGSGLGIHCSVGPTLEEELQHMYGKMLLNNNCSATISQPVINHMSCKEYVFYYK